MILIELEAEKPRRFRLEFHPRLTVVSGLSADLRRQLVAALHQAVSTGRSEISVTVDVDGQPQLLTPELVANVGLSRASIDNVIRGADLPGAVIRSTTKSAAEADEAARTGAGLGGLAPAGRSEVPTPVQIARGEYLEAQQRLEALEQRLAQLKAQTQAPDRATVDRALAAYNRALDRIEQLEVQLGDYVNEPPSISAGERLARARKVRETLQERMAQLSTELQEPPVDVAALERVLDAIKSNRRNLAQVGLATSESSPGDLADKWSALVQQLDRAQNVARPPEWLVQQTRDQLEEATARVKALTMQLGEGIDVSRYLEKARQQLQDAEIVWQELHADGAVDTGALEAQLEAVYAEAQTLLGEDVDPAVVEDSLRALQREFDGERDLRDELFTLLSEAGFAVSLEHVVDSAYALLTTYRNNDTKRPQLQRELAEVAVNIQQMSEEISGLERRIAEFGDDDLDPRDALRRELQEAEAFATDMDSRLRQMKARAAAGSGHNPEVQELERECAEAREVLETASRKVEYFAQREATKRDDDPSAQRGPAAGAGVARSGGEPWWEAGATPSRIEPAFDPDSDEQVDLSRVVGEDAEFYVLSRAAALRRAGRGESVPLLIDAAIDELPDDVAIRLIEVLPRIAPIVQVVYLSGGDRMERWAKRQPEMIAAVVRPERI